MVATMPVTAWQAPDEVDLAPPTRPVKEGKNRL
jgi:hypothetical protein